MKNAKFPLFIKMLLMMGVVHLSSIAFAASGVTYHGRILRPGGEPVDGNNVGFYFRVLSADGTDCPMYEEIRTADLSSSKGSFSIVIGNGAVVGTYNVTGVSIFDQVFENDKTFNFTAPAGCIGTPYVAGSRDGRKLQVQFRETPVSPWEDLPLMTIAHVPFAYSALVAKKVGTHDSSSLLRVENAGTPAAATALTSANMTELMALLGGSTTQYIKSVTGTAGQIGVNTTLGAATVSLLDVATVTPGTYGSATQVPVFTVDAKGRVTGVTNTTITGGGGGGITDLTGDVTASGTGSVAATIANNAVTTAKINNAAVTDVKLASDSVTTVKILDANVTLNKLASDSVNSAKIVDGSITGSDLSGTAALSVASIAATGNVGAGTVSTRSLSLFELPANGTDYVGLKAPDNVGSFVVFTLPGADGTAGQILKTDGSGNLSWVNDATGGSPVDSSYAAKGVVQFDTDAATSGITVASGVAKIATGGVSNAMLANAAVGTTKVADDAISFAKLQNVATNKLLGRGTALSGDVEEITLGTGLSLSGTTLNATVTDSFAALPCTDGYLPYKAAGVWTCKQVASANTNDAIVTRDSSGNFISGTGQFSTSVKITDGAAGGQVTIAAPGTFTSYNLTLPVDDGAPNQVLQTNGSGVLAWANGVSQLPNIYTDGVGALFMGPGTPTSGNVGSENTAFGGDSMKVMATGSENTAFGYGTLSSSTVSYENSAFGWMALFSNTTGQFNTAIGAESLWDNTTGSENTAVGTALTNNTTGSHNTGIGMVALNSNTTGNENVGLGINAGRYNKTGSFNVFLGSRAGTGALNNADVSNNTFVGASAGAQIMPGADNNILLGYRAGYNLTSGSKNIVLGYDVSVPTATATNTLNIGNLIFGTGLDGSGTTVSAGNIGIGVVTPNGKLDVAGSIVMSGSASGYSGFRVPAAAGSTVYELPAADGSANQVLKTNGSGVLSWVNDATGGSPSDASYAAKGVVQFDTDLATSGITVASGVAKIGTGGVSAGMLATDSVTTNKIANLNVTTGKIADDAVSFAKMQNISTNKLLGRGTALSGDVEEITLGTGLSLTGTTLNSSGIAAVTNTANLANTKIWIGDSGGKAQEFSLSGDATMTAGGVVTVDATAANTVNKIVKRDASGNFVAGTGQFSTAVKITDGGAGGQVTIAAPGTFTSYNLTLPTDDGGVDQVLKTNGSGVLSWVNQPTVPSTTGMIVDGGNTTGAEIVVGTDDAQKLSFETANAKRMTIDATGNVGIGTTAPNANLSINTSNTNTALRMRTSSTGAHSASIQLDNYSTGGAPNFNFVTGRGTFGSPSAVTTSDILGQILFWGYGDTTSRNGASIVARATATGVDAGVSTKLVFATASSTDTAPVDRMTITPSGDVGIGTTTPGGKLHVAGDIVAYNVYASNLPSGRIVNSPGGTAGYWVRIGGVTFNTQSQYYNAQYAVTSGASGFSRGINAKLYFRVKQLAAMGSPPVINVEMDSSNSLLKKDDVAAVTTTNSGAATIVSFYVRANQDWESIFYAPIAAGGWTVVHDFDPAGFVAALPGGTPTYATAGSSLWSIDSGTNITYSGNVGIGTNDPGTNTKLRVAGQVAPAVGSIATGAIDFSSGNTVITSFNCGSTLSLANLREGGSYTLVVTHNSTTQCNFPASTTGDDAGAVTYRWKPSNGPRDGSSTHTIYNLFRAGNIVYIGWSSGW